MKERIKRFLSIEKITATQLADNIDVQRSSISHIISGRNNPGYDFIIKILKKYPELNADWLLLGEGDMYKKKSQASLFNDDLRIAPDIEDNDNTESLQMSTKQNTNVLSSELPLIDTGKDKGLEKIVIFFKNKTFKEYYPQV